MLRFAALIESMDCFLEAESSKATTKKTYAEEVRKKVGRMIGRNYLFKILVDKHGWTVATAKDGAGILASKLEKVPGVAKNEGYSKEHANHVVRFKPKGFDEQWSALT